MRTQSLLFISGIFIVASCSNLVESTRESLLGGNKTRKSPKQEVKWVSKAQYDDLMSKYKSLNQKYESLKENKMPSQTNAMADETIDVFAQTEKQSMKQEVAQTSSSKASSGVAIDVSQIDEEIDYYKRARLMLKAGKTEEALKLFQYLEKAKSKQIQVRSKRYIGDIYFQKQQFDLALQVYESIIRQYSFSGSVLPALRNASKCSEALGLMNKKEQYQSMLRDFFGMQV
ncbi:MAG: hypothetical protein CME65_01385 [Halobacteriovoraceae bacterium]|nr:hypothetical protein [Halobacteriovoraceae bacterium]|tara:strand:+ start:102 stop:791 length:690 start_codon:yes stop_codon:yes gene_type:complete